MATTRFIFPEHHSGVKPIIEQEDAILPEITWGSRGSKATLPPVIQRAPASKKWPPALPADHRDLYLAHYKHYDVQLDWAEVRAVITGSRELEQSVFKQKFKSREASIVVASRNGQYKDVLSFHAITDPCAHRNVELSPLLHCELDVTDQA